MRNLPIDTRNLGIFLNNKGHFFQIPKESRGALPLFHNQWTKKDKFFKWANGRLKNPKHMLRSSKNLSHRYT